MSAAASDLTTQGPQGPFLDERYRPLVDAFRQLFQRKRDGGGALALFRDGQPVVDVWAGYANPETGAVWQADTMAMSYSTSKGVTSTLVHRLVERGVLAYDEPVASWWPEFAAHGKHDILLSDVLTHRSGMHKIRGVVETPGDLLDHRRVADRLAARRPSSLRGVPAYHALTFGWLVAAVVERATGKSFADVLAEEVSGPLQLDGCYISTPVSEQGRIAPLSASSLPMGLSAEQIGGWLRRIGRLRPAVDALLPVGFDAYVNTPAMLGATIPAANGVFTARSLARIYGALANKGTVGGTQLLQPDTVATIGKVQTKQRDRVLGFSMRWRLGYHQGFVADGQQPRMAFGHFGYGGSGAWADPETGLSIGFITNRLGSLTTPIADVRLARLGGVALDCARR